MRIMRRILGERKGLFAGNLSLRLVKDLLPFIGPILVGITVDLLSGTDRSLLGIELRTNHVRSILIVAIAMALLAVAKTVFGYIHTIVAAHMGRHVVEAARRDLAEAAMQMSLDRRRSFNSGDLLDRSLADTKGLRTFTQSVIIRVISNTARAVVPLTMMFAIDPVMALIVLAVIPLQSGFSGMLQRRLQRQTRDARSREATHTSAVKEAIDGFDSLASVSGQDWFASELRSTAAASEEAKITKKHTTASISAVINLCTALGIAACYAIGGWRIIDSGVLDDSGTAAAGAMTLGSLTTFIGVAKKTYAPFQAYTKIVSNYRTGLVNLERISEVLDAPMVDPRPDGPELNVTGGRITLDSVSFSYDEGNTPTLRHLTGAIPGRSLTVITGSSGAGKTTLLRLLMGLDVPDTGSICIDAQDINVARLASVQHAVALVPQDPMLFTGTLGENLILGYPNTTTEDLLEACRRAGLVEMVRDMPDGLSTEVGSGRHVLSGGQLRRMAIARALLRKPAILLLDEPTTGLDQANSKQVLDTLRDIGEHTTVVMVSHRRGPLLASDHHLVLHDGTWTEGAQRNETEADGYESVVTGGEPLGREMSATVNGRLAAANGDGPPQTVTGVSRQTMGLSAMGRAITLSSLDPGDATTRLMVVSGHRADTTRPKGFLALLAASIAADADVAGPDKNGGDTQARVAVAAIPDLNPDAPWMVGRQTVLGIDPAADHERLVSVETSIFHTALDRWEADLVIDVAQSPKALESTADIDIAFYFVAEADGSPPRWMTKLALDVGQRLKHSRFTSHVSVIPAPAGGLTAAKGLPVIEVTATNAPEVTTDERSLEALVEATTAVYGAVAINERVTAPI